MHLLLFTKGICIFVLYYIKTTQEKLSFKAINVIYTLVVEFLQNHMKREARIAQYSDRK
jgi:hypothetical protein